MGKCCIRFKKVEDLPLDVIGDVIGAISVQDYIRRYETILASQKGRKKK
jgi:hypothetical protein